MKSQCTSCTVITILCIILLCPVAVRAQERIPPRDGEYGESEHSPEGEKHLDPLKGYYASDLFPVYEVETLHRTDRKGDIVLPLIHKGSLYAFSLHTGLPLWRIFIGGDLQNPFTVRDSTVYFYDIYNRVYAIDLNRGEIFWRIYLTSEIKGKLNIYRGLIVAPTLNGVIHFIDREDGEIRFSYQGEGEINAGLSIHENLIIVPYRKGKIVAYDMQTLTEAWTFSSGGLISVQPVIRDGQIYLGSWDDTFYALDIATGKPLWTTYVGNTVTREFLVFNDEVILFFSNGEMVCLNRNRGDIRWVKYFKGVEFNYNYFQGNQRIYVLIPDFIALDPVDGEMLFDYRERSFFLYKEMLFDNMVMGERPISEEERARLLSEKYFTVSSYPYLPPAVMGKRFVYFITDNATLYIYDLERDFFRLKYHLP